MLIELLRLFGLILTGIILYKGVKYYISAPRKLEAARNHGHFLLLDDIKNPRKNFLLTYKGAVFEGEKYLGITEESFAVISISIWPRDMAKLETLSQSDFLFIQNELLKSYPKASIEWTATVKDLLRQQIYSIEKNHSSNTLADRSR
ncbi:sigma-w pathway protein ysdB [Neobacillus notoginsengisoli]|uniref:Sigma-w pathway protein ysdB n=1 Tax=Neobacillus notoginsengisoli TaxID=1578198 RepID=A0A417YU67_9BACI|nr:sigma-w pathway protein ysdB [Neobacillus notoginsengisoli]